MCNDGASTVNEDVILKALLEAPVMLTSLTIAVIKMLISLLIISNRKVVLKSLHMKTLAGGLEAALALPG